MCLFVALDVADDVLDGADLLRLLVRDLHVVLLLERHHQLHDVERVRAEILDEGGLRRDFLLAHAELLADDLLHLLLHAGSHHSSLTFSRPTRRASHVEAAVHVQHLPGDVACVRGGEERDRRGDLLGRGDAARGNHVRVKGPLLVVEPRRHVRLDQAGGDRVHGDAARRHLARQRLREPDHARLRRRIRRLPRVAHLRHHRGEIHDPPVPGADHGTDRGLGTVEDAGQVGAQDPLPVLLLEPQEERVHGHARIVDEEVEPPVLVNDVLHPDTHRLGVADVEAGRGRAAAGGGDQAHRLFGRGRVLAEVDHRRRPGGRKAQRDGAPDAARAAGHERDLAGERPAHAASASRARAMPSRSPAGTLTSDGAIRLLSPERTRPGPVSRASVAPSAASARTVSSQRTGAVICLTSRPGSSAAPRTGRASTLLTTGSRGSWNVTPARWRARPAAAGSISGQWNGALTARSCARARRAAASPSSRSTARVCPATTTWPPPSRFAGTSTSPSAASAQSAATASASSPRMAAIAPSPGGTASCMSRPRSRTPTTASPSASAPAATSADHSPRLWPATAAGSSAAASSSTR